MKPNRLKVKGPNSAEDGKDYAFSLTLQCEGDIEALHKEPLREGKRWLLDCLRQASEKFAQCPEAIRFDELSLQLVAVEGELATAQGRLKAAEAMVAPRFIWGNDDRAKVQQRDTAIAAAKHQLDTCHVRLAEVRQQCEQARGALAVVRCGELIAALKKFHQEWFDRQEKARTELAAVLERTWPEMSLCRVVLELSDRPDSIMIESGFAAEVAALGRLDVRKKVYGQG